MLSPRVLCALCALLLIALVLPAGANASASQLALFQDDRELLQRGSEVRDARLDELKALGADVVKAQVYWARVAPGATAKPAGFDGTDLSTYPTAAFERYDGLVRAAHARGLRVLLALAPPVPGWATAKRGDAEGVYRPSAREFGRFARAVASRYDGTHVDSAGQPLPRVSLWSIWNEPNHPRFLQPQSSSRGTPIAPHLYRELVRYGVDGLRRAGHAGSTILFGELLPIGHSAAGPNRTIKPIAFLRSFFCLDRPCSGFRRVSGVTGFAYHPYTRPDGPRGVEPTSDDATIRSIGRVTAALDRAAARGRLSRRGLPVWNTEFGYQSDPPDPYQTRLSRIPAFLNESEWISYRNRRVASWSQYGLVDDPLLADARDRYGLFQAALRFDDGSAKASVYEAYRSPLFVRLSGTRSVELWGAARPAAPGAQVEIQQRLRGTSSYRQLRVVTLENGRGYFRGRLRISRPESRTYRFVYDDAGTTRTSRTAKAARR